MNELTNFKFQDHAVKTIEIDGQVWFVAKDIADILEYSDAEAMTRRLDGDEIQNRQIVGFGNRGVNIISESGLYSAILGSNKPEAKTFKKWVTSEVLPAIRKNGHYSIQEAKNPDLSASVIAMLDKLNQEIAAGNYPPPHVLKYAYHLAHTLGIPVLNRAMDSESQGIYAVIRGFHANEWLSRSEVYCAYESQTANPVSPRRFWGLVQSVRPFNNKRGHNERCVSFIEE